MEWYYAINQQKYGPAGAAELAELGRKGTILADDLVWREGMQEWLPFRRTAGEIYRLAGAPADAGDDEEASEVDAVETAVCAHSSRVLPKSELIPYGDRWIDPEHKDAFLQGLMETGGSGALTTREPDDFDAPALIPVGFWWRVLSTFIDNLVLWLPSMLCMIPYIVVSAGATTQPANAENPLSGWTAAMGITYALGLLGTLAVSGFYHSWMLVKWRATLGKMAIGAVVVRPDGSSLTYGRAISRWLCFAVLGYVITMVFVGIGAGIGGAIMAVTLGAGGEDNAGAIAGGVFIMLIVAAFFAVIGAFPYWMAAFDKEKRALHDRICATRVVKKFEA